MGMFDDIRCKYPLPVPGANDLDYQTKDTGHQYMDQYEIREDGTLWHEDYDIEDQSDLAKWRAAHPGEEPPEEMTSALASWAGCMARINKRWRQVKCTGEIGFYNTLGTDHSGWIEWSAYFIDGELQTIVLVENRKPNQPQEKET